jgi:hypothetical protein
MHDKCTTTMFQFNTVVSWSIVLECIVARLEFQRIDENTNIDVASIRLGPIFNGYDGAILIFITPLEKVRSIHFGIVPVNDENRWDVVAR